LNKKQTSPIKSWLELTKFKLSFAVALSPVAGYFMFGEIDTDSLIGVFIGTLLLSCAVIALNQYQERFIDAKMDRTKNRPLPSGAIGEKTALYGIATMIGTGLIVLWILTNPLTTLLGAINGLWYNVVYTPLKRKSAFAVIPGGLCGAIPPIMGWTAAGGYLWDSKIIVLALFFFIWQVPHFWLILLKFGEQYEKAGLSSVTRFWNKSQLKGITFVWMITTGVSALLLPVFNMVHRQSLKIALVLVAFTYMGLTFKALYGYKEKVSYFLAFMVINLFLMAVIFILIIQQYIG
jgi:protoheme IX farnesyltransferase